MVLRDSFGPTGKVVVRSYEEETPDELQLPGNLREKSVARKSCPQTLNIVTP